MEGLRTAACLGGKLYLSSQYKVSKGFHGDFIDRTMIVHCNMEFKFTL